MAIQMKRPPDYAPLLKWLEFAKRTMWDPSSRFQRDVSFIVPLVLYTILTIIYFIPKHIALSSSIFNPSPDPFVNIWFLNWWPFAFSRGLNPFVTNYIWAPTGYNLAWAGSIPTFALLFAPITRLFGAIASYNVVSLLAYPLSAWAGFLLFRYLTKDFFASLLAGYSFGFSSYVLGQSLGHTNLSFVGLIPLAILFTVMRYQGRLRPVAFIALVATIAVLEFGIYSEVFATATFFGAIAVACVFVFDKRSRGKLISISKELTIAYILSAIILSPLIYYLIIGLPFVPKVINSRTAFSADLFNYIIPTNVTFVGHGIFQNVAGYFTGNITEQGAYIGIVLLLITILSIRENIKKPWGKALFALTIFTVLCSLGPYLQIDDVNTRLRMPWALGEHIPLLGRALPTRFTVYVALCVAAWLAYWLSGERLTRTQTVGRYAVALLGLALIVPNPGAWSWGAIKTPTFFKDQGLMSSALRQEKNIVVLPYGSLGASMLWQYESRMYFHMAGGYVGWTPAAFTEWPAVQLFYGGPVPGYRKQLSAFCAAHSVQSIVVGPGVRKTWVAALGRLHWHRKAIGGVVVYSVPHVVSREYRGVTSTKMATSFLLRQFRALKIAAVCFLKKGGTLATLTPFAAEKAGCLNGAYGGYPATAPNNNWTKMGGWLGTMSHGIGVGVVASNTREARGVIKRFGLSAQTIYFPYPMIWNASRRPARSVVGQVILVFKHSVLSNGA